MKVKLHHSLQRAFKVLRLIDLPAAMAEQVWAECFDNCREQGLTLVAWFGGLGNSRAIYVSEHRSSDSTVVYVDEDGSTRGGQNMPNDAAWASAKHFSPGEERQAAAYIRSWITSWAQRAREQASAKRAAGRL